jgi:hypothetical protein
MEDEKYYWVLKYPKDGDAFAVAIGTKSPEWVIDPRTFERICVRNTDFRHPVVFGNITAVTKNYWTANNITVVPTYNYKPITKEEFETLLAFKAVPEVVFSPEPMCWEPKF